MEDNKPNIPSNNSNNRSPTKPSIPKAPGIPGKPSMPPRPQTIRKPVSNVNAVKKQSVDAPAVSRLNANKEQESQNKLINRKNEQVGVYTKEHQELLKDFEYSNKRIRDKKRSIRKPYISQSNPLLKGAKGLGAMIFTGLIMAPIVVARKLYIAYKKSAKKNKSKRKLLLLLLLLLLIFGSLATGTYFIINNVIQNQSSITEDDIFIPENDFNEFMLPVIDYMYGDKVERGLRLYNTARRVDVYVAFKMEVQEELENGTTTDIDLKAIPVLPGNDVGTLETSLWIGNTLNSGTTYYYYKDTLKSDGNSLTLFRSYDVEIIPTSSLQVDDLAGRKLQVKVTIYAIDASSKSNITTSSSEVWKEMPATIIDILP